MPREVSVICPVCGRLTILYLHPDNGWEMYAHRDRRGFPERTQASDMPWCPGRRLEVYPPGLAADD